MAEAQLPAGSELNRLVCEEFTLAGVPGWEPYQQSARDAWPDQPNPTKIYPAVSEDWAVAGRALEAMRGLGYWFQINTPIILNDWQCEIYTISKAAATLVVDGETGPHAIALALLEALRMHNNNKREN